MPPPVRPSPTPPKGGVLSCGVTTSLHLCNNIATTLHQSLQLANDSRTRHVPVPRCRQKKSAARIMRAAQTGLPGLTLFGQRLIQFCNELSSWHIAVDSVNLFAVTIKEKADRNRFDTELLTHFLAFLFVGVQLNEQ